MNFLLLLRLDESAFEEAAVFGAVRLLPGLERADRQRRIDSVLEGHVWHEGDGTIVRLSEDRSAISLSGSGPATFSAAFALSRLLPVPVHVVDSDYVLDIPMKDVESADDLRRRYQEAVASGP